MIKMFHLERRVKIKDFVSKLKNHHSHSLLFRVKFFSNFNTYEMV